MSRLICVLAVSLAGGESVNFCGRLLFGGVSLHCCALVALDSLSDVILCDCVLLCKLVGI